VVERLGEVLTLAGHKCVASDNGLMIILAETESAEIWFNPANSDEKLFF
jgi:hypothetical protein